MLNSDSRNRSAVGLISREAGAAMLRPRKRPPTTRISTHPEACARSCPCRAATAARPAIAPALVVAGRLRHCRSAAPARGGPCRPKSARSGPGLDGFFRAAHRPRPSGFSASGWSCVGPLKSTPASVAIRSPSWSRSTPFVTSLDLAFREFVQLERSVGDPDQSVHLEPEMLQDVAHLAVLALTHCKRDPDIGALAPCSSVASIDPYLTPSTSMPSRNPSSCSWVTSSHAPAPGNAAASRCRAIPACVSARHHWSAATGLRCCSRAGRC